MCLLPIMTIMWICTSLCVYYTIPNLSLVLFESHPNRSYVLISSACCYGHWLLCDLYGPYPLPGRREGAIL